MRSLVPGWMPMASDVEIDQMEKGTRLTDADLRRLEAAADEISDELRLEWASDPTPPEWQKKMAALHDVELKEHEQMFDNDAKRLYYQGHYSGSIHSWRRALAIAALQREQNGKKRDVSYDGDTATAVYNSNIGASLHRMERYEDAIDMYRTAIDMFEAAESSRGRISRWLGDDSGAARKQFVEHRMRLACRREQPRAGEYLDQRGRIRYTNEGGGAPAAG